MKIVQRGQITYYIKKESIIVGINNFQFTAYNVYPLQNRKPFYDFKNAILKSKEDQYDSPNKLVSLALRFKLIGVASHKPSQDEMSR